MWLLACSNHFSRYFWNYLLNCFQKLQHIIWLSLDAKHLSSKWRLHFLKLPKVNQIHMWQLWEGYWTGWYWLILVKKKHWRRDEILLCSEFVSGISFNIIWTTENNYINFQVTTGFHFIGMKSPFSFLFHTSWKRMLLKITRRGEVGGGRWN